MAGYYDFVLGLIPLALGGVSGALTVAGISLTPAIVAASLVAVGLIGHAMFVRTPSDGRPPTRKRRRDGPDIGAN